MMINTVLIVDDDIEIIKAVKDIFPSYLNLKILHALRIDQAQRICDTLMIDLVICDYCLPDSNGGVLFEHLLSKKQHPLFILYTGSSSVISLPPDCKIHFQAVSNKDLGRLRLVVESLLTDFSLQF